ncbi:hypothetical protein F5890DRAFT_509345 [Lentinula detonsa]|uniref:Uncharacterized protein n=1 Tax=Lentinula detonsa TaxID=2804962 RepID=A0AA38PUQ3_9AGAR|nr:hypothetical protein F5890DRAFT_509345 [Lentinula detonsa]
MRKYEDDCIVPSFVLFIFLQGLCTSLIKTMLYTAIPVQTPFAPCSLRNFHALVPLLLLSSSKIHPNSSTTNTSTAANSLPYFCTTLAASAIDQSLPGRTRIQFDVEWLSPDLLHSSPLQRVQEFAAVSTMSPGIAPTVLLSQWIRFTAREIWRFKDTSNSETTLKTFFETMGKEITIALIKYQRL